MIPVERQSEPSNFSKQVRIPGERFLSENSSPSSRQWRNKEYWQRALPDMRKVYKGICAYSACWIPYTTGNHSIDHFVPKSQQPELAYEWDNYRYSSARFNSRKGVLPIVDPFTLLPGAFTLDFRSFLIKPNPEFSMKEQPLLRETIQRLKLNDDEELILERQEWYSCYSTDKISFAHLQSKAPFIAFELERQNLLRPEINRVRLD